MLWRFPKYFQEIFGKILWRPYKNSWEILKSIYDNFGKIFAVIEG